ncbi:MAG: transposase [Paracoccaceae bacterium]|nr:transposase [Paracoccaceae bacterium]MDG1369462.1 transposase [Paracoccaceae bacterium]
MATWREARRGKYSVGFKKRVVAEALVPGASVANIARAHGLNGNMIFGWRKDPRFQPTEKKRKAMEAALADAGSKATKPAIDEPAFLPIEVAVHSATTSEAGPTSKPETASSGISPITPATIEPSAVIERSVVKDTPDELAVMSDVHMDRFVVPSSVLFVTEFDAGLIERGYVDKGTLEETIVTEKQIVHPSRLGCVFVLDVSFVIVTQDDGCLVFWIADIEVSECDIHEHLVQWLCYPYTGEVPLTRYILPTILQTDQSTDM